MDAGDEEVCVTILCPREIAAFSAEPGLYWLIGSPRFLPPITVVSTLRCLHLHDSDRYSPEYPSESGALRTFVIRGFNVIGALCVGDGEREENARRAIDSTLLLKKHIVVDEDGAGFDVVGAAADLVSKEIHFFRLESTRSSSLKRLHSVVHHEGNPEKILWENGCLLRCQLEFKLPIYVPEGKISGAENMLTSVTDDVIAKLRDPQVAFLVEGTHTTNPPILLRGAEMNSDSQSLANSAAVMEKLALPCSHFAPMQKGLMSYNVRENADIIRVTVLSNRSADEQSCFPPIAQFLPATLSPRLVVSSFKLDVLCYSSKDFPVSSSISRLMVPGLIDQLIALRKSIGPKVLLQPELCPYHFFPPGILHPVTAIYELSYGETEMVQVEIRRSLHLRMGLPLDRPLLRVANSLTFGTVGRSNPSKAGSVIKDVHVDIPRSGVSGGLSSLIDGSYEYYHYLQDGLDDNGWGCAYRSLQTIISWFGLQHYTSLKVPSHREIQQTLVEIGDKDPSFVGSHEWIGAIELSFVLDKLLGVSCKIINVRSGAELPEKCRELALHFKNQGTPVMIGGGVLAYTLLGVDYNDASGDCAFLILDPHYTGGDDQKKIVSGGWCSWKKPVDSKGRNFFMHDKFYNLLLPQRPNMV